jgi:hypothetical protein
LIYKRAISEEEEGEKKEGGRERENDRLVNSAKYSTKVMWQSVTKHMGKLFISNWDIELKN